MLYLVLSCLVILYLDLRRDARAKKVVVYNHDVDTCTRSSYSQEFPRLRCDSTIHLGHKSLNSPKAGTKNPSTNVPAFFPHFHFTLALLYVSRSFLFLPRSLSFPCHNYYYYHVLYQLGVQIKVHCTYKNLSALPAFPFSLRVPIGRYTACGDQAPPPYFACAQRQAGKRFKIWFALSLSTQSLSASVLCAVPPAPNSCILPVYNVRARTLSSWYTKNEGF